MLIAKQRLSKICDSKGDLTKKWYVSFYLFNEDTGLLERKRTYVDSKLDKKERYIQLTQIKNTVDQLIRSGGTNKKKINIGLIEAIDQAIEFKKTYVSPRTYANYKQITNNLIDWIGKKKASKLKLNELSKSMSIEFMEHLKITRNIKAKTYNTYKGDLKAIFDRLIEKEYISSNPFQGIKSLKETDPEIHIWTDEEQTKLTTHLKKNDPGMYLLINFIYHTFLRPWEILQLRFCDIDLEKQLIYLRPDLTKNKKAKAVTLTDQLKKLILDHKETHKVKNDTTYLFSKDLEPGKTPMARNTLNTRFRTIKKCLKLPAEAHMYGFKHKGNFDLHLAGLTVEEIRQQNRHYDLSITTRYLGRIVKEANMSLISKAKDF